MVPENERWTNIKSRAISQIGKFLEDQMTYGVHDPVEKEKAKNKAQIVTQETIKNIEGWLSEDIPSVCKESVFSAIDQNRWPDVVEAFWQNITFGTGGIRGRIVVSTDVSVADKELHELNDHTLSATVLRGTNTINEVIIMKYTAGVARYMKRRGMKKVVVGCDSRMMGMTYARLVARVFLANDFVVYLFDSPSPVPELSFAVTNLEADMGIELTASHNDRRYNGYKIAVSSGASPSIKERNEIADDIFGSSEKQILPITMSDVKLVDLEKAPKDNLVYLGGEEPSQESTGRKHINMHERHVNHIKTLISRPDIVKNYASEVHIGYCAFHGAGYKTVPRLLKELGFTNLKIVTKMNKPDPFFPSFGPVQMLDPGDVKAVKVAIKEFIAEHGEDSFNKLDMMIGTDPDSDRMGLVVRVPKSEQGTHGKWKLLNADDVWTLLLWYRLHSMNHSTNGRIPDSDKMFIIKNHVTTDALAAVAAKFGVRCDTTWVGFGELASRTRVCWQSHEINVGMFEESNGYTIAGAPPADGKRLGLGGHTLEKDGNLAAVFVAEVAAYAEANDTSIMELLNKLYADPDVGYYATIKLQIPEDGVFEGTAGELKKQHIIKKVEQMMDEANKKWNSNSPMTIAGLPISSAEEYCTGKYDKKYWKNFPDEGIRFFFDSSKTNHVIVRASGTEPKLRVMVQYRITGINENNVLQKKIEGEALVEKIAKDIIEKALQ